MTDAQWKQVWVLYEKAYGLSPDDARAFLQSVSDDPDIIREVLAILNKTGPSPKPDSNRSGQTIGRYVVGECIGCGATGEVYAGRDTVLNRAVGLKFISSEYAGVDSIAKRFFREAQAASALNHPNIVTVFELVTSGTSPVIVMELVDGQPLRNLCKGSLPETQVRRIGLQIAQALAAAHARDIVHRDLKPENVMVRPDGYVKVLDFGLAKVLHAAATAENFTSTVGLPVGTLRYMSPEQCKGEPATPASDVFSFGICLYEMYTGSHPFDRAGSAIDTAHAIVWDEPKPIAAKGAMAGLIASMLAKDPHQRPASRQIAESLELPAIPQPRRTISRRWIVGATVLSAAAASARLWWPSARPSRDSFLVKGGELRDPVFSPDGSKIAFSWKVPSSPTSHIYLTGAQGGTPTQITTSVAHDIDPAWSPDGSRLSFVRQGQGECAVYVTEPKPGAAETRVTTIYFRDFSGRADWLDNNTIVVSDRGNGGFYLARVDLRTGQRTDLTERPPHDPLGDSALRRSPDGRFVAFNRFTSLTSADLHIVPALGGPARRLTFDMQPKRDFRWTPDGRGLLFKRPDRPHHLFYVSSDGGVPKEISLSFLLLGSFAIAPGPTGTLRLVFAGAAITDSIFRVNIPSTGDSPTPVPFISSARGNYDVHPVISPNGLQVAFVSNRSGSTQIWVSDNEGKNPRQLTFLEKVEVSPPAWSPDGQHIVASAPLNGRGQIFLLDPTGQAPMHIIEQKGTDDFAPQFSADGRSIVFCSAREGVNLWTMPREGGEARKLTTQGGQISRASRDGKWIYYVRRGDVGLFRIPARGGEEELVLDRVTSEFYRGWALGRNGIYYTVRDASTGMPVIQYFDQNLGSHRIICRLTRPLPRWTGTLAVSNDESWLAVPLEDVEESRMCLYDGIRL